jgi:hypothetical protein
MSDIRERHRYTVQHGGTDASAGCSMDGQRWPCDAIEADDRADKAEAALERFRLAMVSEHASLEAAEADAEALAEAIWRFLSNDLRATIPTRRILHEALAAHEARIKEDTDA